MKTKPSYIIYTWSYSDEIGGIMALHKLCDVLRKSGHDAYLWPAEKEIPTIFPGLRWWLWKIKNKLRPTKRKRFLTNENYDTPLAPLKKIKNAIVLYPEIVPGNPLKARHVVRWFLNKPGRLRDGHIDYGPDDFYFCYQQTFNDLTFNPEGRQLIIVTVMSEIYRQTNFGDRTGTCYILRKGKSRVHDKDALQGPIIDGRSHKEIAKLFNENEYCVSYDSYSMYSAYAAMCGCKSIVVPEPGVDKAKWQSIEEMTFGIAYGEDEVDWAVQTRDKLMATYARLEEENFSSVAAFVKACDEKFFPSSKHISGK